MQARRIERPFRPSSRFRGGDDISIEESLIWPHSRVIIAKVSAGEQVVSVALLFPRHAAARGRSCLCFLRGKRRAAGPITTLAFLVDRLELPFAPSGAM